MAWRLRTPLGTTARARLLGALATLLVALGPALLPACVQNDGSMNPLANIGKVTEDDERETGAKVDAEFQSFAPLIDDPEILGFLNDLGQDLVRHIEPQPFIYRFRLLSDPSLNAFAIPGGYIYFHTGTVMQAGSLEELAGVMAHEIAHVKARHYARIVEGSTIPNLLTRVAAVGLAVAAETPAPLIIGEGVNVALQIQFTRQFEAEADDLATAFLARGGYDPAGMADFFRRIIIAEKKAGPRFEPPPYLYTHPDVENRVDAALLRAEGTTVIGTVPEHIRRGFRRAQLRLALMQQRGVTTLRAPPPDRSIGNPYLKRARQLRDAGDTRGALALLTQAESLEPNDPRMPFERGEIHHAAGRTEESIEAWRRALLLDPGVGLVFFKIGEAYQKLGDRINATFYFEQAARRFEPGGSGQKRAQRQVERLTFPVIRQAGITAGSDSEEIEVLIAAEVEELPAGSGQAMWWGRVGGRYVPDRDQIRVRFVDPMGTVVQERPVLKLRRPVVSSHLSLAGATPGIWRVEAVFEDSVVDRRAFRVSPPARTSGTKETGEAL